MLFPPLEKGDQGGFADVVHKRTLKIPLLPPRFALPLLQRGKQNTKIYRPTNIVKCNKLLGKPTHLSPASTHRRCRCSRGLLKFAMPNLTEAIACYFPLWKRGKQNTKIYRQTNIVKCNKLLGKLTHLPTASAHHRCRCTRGLLKFAMPNPSEAIACYFPLWKRGTKGDLQTLSTSER